MSSFKMLVEVHSSFSRFPMPAAKVHGDSVWGDHVSYFITALHGSMDDLGKCVDQYEH